MFERTISVAVVVLLPLLGSQHLQVLTQSPTATSVAADTPTSTPTATATSLPSRDPTKTTTWPAGSMLLKAMEQTMRARNSVHVAVGGSVFAPGGLPSRLSGFADISLRPKQSHQVLVTTPRGQHGDRQEVLVRGRVVAQRSDHTAWRCKAVKHVAASIFDPALLPAGIRNVVNRGPSVVQGTRVWHLRARYLTNQGALQAVDLYIRRSDHTLLRQVQATDFGDEAGGNVLLTFEYSHYGEPVHLRMPSVCPAPS